MADKGKQNIQDDQPQNILDDTTLNIEQASFAINPRWKRTKSPMLVIPSVILDLEYDDLRESTLSYLTNYLREIACEDPEMYSLAGSILYYFSQLIMSILKEEVWRFVELMLEYQCFTAKSCNRLCIAASGKARLDFAACSINFLTPLIAFSKYHEKIFEKIRAAALSVVKTLRHANVRFIDWALNNGVVGATLVAKRNGSELSKEALRAFSPGPELSHQRMPHIVSCYFRLCTDISGLNALKTKSLSIGTMIDRFDYMLQKLPPDIGQILSIVVTFLRRS